MWVLGHGDKFFLGEQKDENKENNSAQFGEL
jgi:hypothetical protein